jgi:hypothetical protein
MTLDKYIKRLTDKLDPFRQCEKRTVAENARKARTNSQPTYRPFSRPMALKSQYWRYGFVHWPSRRKRGIKTAQGELLPRVNL